MNWKKMVLRLLRNRVEVKAEVEIYKGKLSLSKSKLSEKNLNQFPTSVL